MSKLQHCGFISLLYSIGEKPLNLWSKHISPDGKISRVIDEILNGDKVIEITGPHNVPVCTNISCPADPTDILNIKLPILVLIIKNLKLHLKLEFQILDKNKYRRKLTFSTEEISPKINTTKTQLPLKLEENWNNLEINFQVLCHDIFGTDYDALQRIIIYPNCCIRRIYLQDRHYQHDEIPVELFQAFFDMYMLKWGIHLVDRTSQTEQFKHTEFLQTNNVENIKTPTNLKRTSSRYNSKRKFKQNTKMEQIRNIDKKLEKTLKRTKNSTKEINLAESFSISVNNDNDQLSKETKNFRHLEKSKYLQILQEPSSSKFEKEGNIFSRWPYKFDDLYEETQDVSTNNDIDKFKKSQNSNRKIEKNMTFPTNGSIMKKEMTDFQKQNVTKIKNIINDVHRMREQLKTHDFNMESENDTEIPEFVELEAQSLEKRPQSKILTSDALVNKCLKSRFKIKKTFEILKKKGFSIADIELSVHNSRKRINSYGQGKLIESCRTSVNKATDYQEIESLEINFSPIAKKLTSEACNKEENVAEYSNQGKVNYFWKENNRNQTNKL